jgi:uncharacterized protein (UPF0276 family)
MSHSNTTPTGVGLGLRQPFLAEVARGAAQDRVAFFEVSPENYMTRGGNNPHWLEQVADRHPVITHGLMMSLGSRDPLNDAYMRPLKEFCGRYGAGWHSDHLCFSGVDGALLHDLLPLPMSRAAVRHVADKIRRVQDRLQKPMIVENISAYVTMGEPEMDEAEFVCEVTEAADCGLLLDVNNIFVNSRNFDFDPLEMLSRMPIDRVKQMHVAGHESWERYDMFVDTHGATVLPRVHEMMQWVIERTGPLPVLLERDTNIPSLEALLEEVAALQSSYDEALARATPRVVGQNSGVGGERAG